jgi:transcription termination factor Rho
MTEKELAAARTIRRHLMNMPPAQAMKNLIEALSKNKTNADLFSTLRTA